MDERPECHADFLGWLIPRWDDLSRLSCRDQEIRNLQGETNRKAIAALASPDGPAYRRVEFILLKKSLYLFYYSKKKHNITESGTSFKALVEHATNILTSDRVDEHVRELLGITRETLDEVGWGQPDDGRHVLSWLELAIRLLPTITNDAADRLVDAIQPYYVRLTTRMATHLQITADQIARIIALLFVMCLHM